MVIVFNFGSSSFKYKVFDEGSNVLIEGKCEKIGDNSGIASFKFEGEEIKSEVTFESHKHAFICVKNLLFDSKIGLLKDKGMIKAVGHRVVHGGVYFKNPVIINKYVLEKIKELIPLAPIHNKSNIDGILDSIEIFGPDVVQVAVFDTSFFTTLPEKVYTYAIPAELSQKYKIRKYGFHGISHKYAYESYKNFKFKDKKLPEELRVVTCHLGSGSSISAIKNGLPIDTSMGISPLGGIMMNCRSGSLDPSVVINLIKYENLDVEKINDIFNKQSGIIGISGVSGDMREVYEKYLKCEKCTLSIDMYCYKIIKCIGSYITILGGCDAIVFTAGIGENFPKIRSQICEGLDIFNVRIDEEKNNFKILTNSLISSINSKIDILVTPADEEKCIFEEVIKII